MCLTFKFYIFDFFFIFQFRKRVFQWCRCSSPGGIQNIFCCCFSSCHRNNDKQSHLEKCQSFYTGLSRSSNGNLVMGPNGLQCSTPNTSKTRFFTGPNRVRTHMWSHSVLLLLLLLLFFTMYFTILPFSLLLKHMTCGIELVAKKQLREEKFYVYLFFLFHVFAVLLCVCVKES